ncbi:MAG TPA: hypothetical protein VGJ18_12030 [Gemmatimonadaceae bacterium]
MSIRSREDLERALRGLGLRCSVEAYDALAVVVPELGDRRLELEDIRRRAIELARAHGFSHLAVELREPEQPPDARATLPRG